MAEQQVKQVETQPVIPVTQTDSPTEREASDNVNYEQVKEELSFSDVEESAIDWPVLEKIEQLTEEKAEEVPKATEEPVVPVQEEPAPQEEKDPLTDSMRERITKLKHSEGEKLADKDQQILARDGQIKELQAMNEKFVQLTQSYRPVTGDAKKIGEELQQLEERLDEEGDTMTAAEIHKLGRRQQQLEKQVEEIRTSEMNTQNLAHQQKQLRNQYDSYVQENYDFVSKPAEEKYKVMKEQSYPILEQLIPNFQQYPHDMVIAAELSGLIVDAQKYRQLIGDQPVQRQEPQPMAGNVTPSAQPVQATRQNLGREVAKVRGGSLDDIAQVLRKAGHGWR